MGRAREFLKAKQIGRVAQITIDHPPMNTIRGEIAEELATLVTEYGRDDAVRAILLDSANQKPAFAADGAALLANVPWRHSSGCVRLASARSQRLSSP